MKENYTDEERALLTLACTEGIGPIICRSLVDTFGSATAVVNASYRELERTPNIGKKLSALLRSSRGKEAAERELEILRRHPDITPLFVGSEGYPSHLANCPDAPIVLYVRGTLPTDGPMISIVGTRRMTHYTTDALTVLLRELAEKCPSAIIVSGLAYGVDVTAHRIAMDRGLRTVAIVAHGHHTLYPMAHKDEAKMMVEQGGGIATEYTFNTKPLPQRFVARNRVVAGLSLATIVTESPARGGALITANLAFDYDRAVFALPGRYFDEMSQGCNELIAKQRATILTSTDQLLEEIGFGADVPHAVPLPFEGQKDYDHPILRLLAQSEGLSIEDISLRCGEPLSSVAAQLFDLELDEKVRALPGGRYALVRR